VCKALWNNSSSTGAAGVDVQSNDWIPETSVTLMQEIFIALALAIRRVWQQLPNNLASTSATVNWQTTDTKPQPFQQNYRLCNVWIVTPKSNQS